VRRPPSWKRYSCSIVANSSARRRRAPGHVIRGGSPLCGLSGLNIVRLLHHLFSHIGGQILKVREKEASREFGNYECRDRGSFSRSSRKYFPSLKLQWPFSYVLPCMCLVPFGNTVNARHFAGSSRVCRRPWHGRTRIQDFSQTHSQRVRASHMIRGGMSIFQTCHGAIAGATASPVLQRGESWTTGRI
jgi:hypothetical protein